jgi:hypothetical protein
MGPTLLEQGDTHLYKRQAFLRDLKNEFRPGLQPVVCLPRRRNLLALARRPIPRHPQLDNECEIASILLKKLAQLSFCSFNSLLKEIQATKLPAALRLFLGFEANRD